MRRRFLGDRHGATAIEFAIVSPLLFAAVFGAIALSMAIWYSNILENVSADTARCIAIGSPLCSSVPTGCSAGTAQQCYATALAASRGMPGLMPENITIDTALVLGSVSFTTVTLRRDLSLLGYKLSLSASNRFPNN